MVIAPSPVTLSLLAIGIAAQVLLLLTTSRDSASCSTFEVLENGFPTIVALLVVFATSAFTATLVATSSANIHPSQWTVDVSIR